MNKIFNFLLNIILPQKCVRCDAYGEILCKNCLPKLKKCRTSLGNDVFSIFSYEDPAVSKAIKLLKYRGIKIVAPAFSNFISETTLEIMSETEIMSGGDKNEKIIVIPVPLHKDRLKERGFNQSEIIAKSIIDAFDKEKLQLENEALQRIKYTNSQVISASRTKRLINLNNTFKVIQPEKIKGKIVLLVDDVITTGATISECKKELLKAGARKVIVLALAH